MSPADFPAALSALRDELGLNQIAAAERLGITTRTLQRYEQGETAPTEERAAVLLERLRSGGTLPVKRQRPASGASTAGAVPDVDESSLLVIPGGGEAGAGAPRSNDGAPREVIVITRAEVERVTGVPSAVGIRWFIVAGDSNVPDFAPGERVYYRETPVLAGDGYHIVALDGEWTVKRIQRHAAGVLDLVPRNTDYATERLVPVRGAEPNTYRSELSGLTCSFRVIGKVVFNLHAR